MYSVSITCSSALLIVNATSVQSVFRFMRNRRGAVRPWVHHRQSNWLKTSSRVSNCYVKYHFSISKPVLCKKEVDKQSVSGETSYTTQEMPRVGRCG